MVVLPADLSGETLSELRPLLLALARDPGASTIVLDGSEVATMSAPALALLVVTARIAEERGGRVQLDRPSPPVARSLLLAGLTPTELTRGCR